jgi:hypothetical protein
MHLSSAPYVPHSAPISTSFLWPPK